MLAHILVEAGTLCTVSLVFSRTYIPIIVIEIGSYLADSKCKNKVGTFHETRHIFDCMDDKLVVIF